MIYYFPSLQRVHYPRSITDAVPANADDAIGEGSIIIFEASWKRAHMSLNLRTNRDYSGVDIELGCRVTSSTPQ